jgi:hypothetical protein
MSWAARNTAEAAIALALDYDWNDGRRTQSALDKLMEQVGADGALKALTSRSAWKRDEAAALGTEVHNLADMLVRGVELPPMGDTTKARVLAYAEWWQNSGWTLRTSEAMLVNTVYGYGGTIDLLARDRDGRTVLADIKTGKAIYSEAVLQLCAYAHGEVIQHTIIETGMPDTSYGPPSVDRITRVYPFPPVDRYVILHVTAGQVREVEVPIGDLEWIAFQACMDLSRWRETQKGKRL